MNEVKIKSLQIKNFKGIAQLDISFDEKITRILAPNGRGKTTINHAWQWLLYQNIEDYLPMLDGKELQDLTTSVTAKVLINGIDYEFERLSLSCFSKDRDTGVVSKTTNKSVCKIDGIELNPKNYKDKIASIFGNGIFDNLILLTNKGYFNSDSTKWGWRERRKLLLEISGANNCTEEILKDEKFTAIRPYILKGYATSDIKSMLKKEKTAEKTAQEDNQKLIAQKETEMNEYLSIDFEKISKDFAIAKTRLTKLNNSTLSEEKTQKIEQLSKELLEKSQELSKLKTTDEIKRQKIRTFSLESYTKASDDKAEITKIDAELKRISDKICEYNQTCIKDYCPACGQKLPEDKINEVNKHIRDEIDSLTKEYEMRSGMKDELVKRYTANKLKFDSLDSDYKNFQPNEKINTLENEISSLKLSIEEIKTSDNDNSNENLKTELENTIFDLQKELVKKDLISQYTKQIKDWKMDNINHSQRIIDIENIEFELQDFVKEQTNKINETVNSKFNNGITWNLYKEGYNGSIDEDCVCLYNRKGYYGLSNGEKNVADFEVIKTLQEYFDLNLPIFVDNAESITINYDTDRQLIEFYATKPEEKSNLEFTEINSTKITDLY